MAANNHSWYLHRTAKIILNNRIITTPYKHKKASLRIRQIL
jgi:hypothetical protein